MGVNILFVTSTRLGDAVLSTGLLGHLIDTYPGACITVACGEVAAPLFQAVPNVVRRIVVVKRRAAIHWLKLWRECVTTRWDLVVDLRGSAFAYLLLARRRRVFRPREAAAHRVQGLASVLGLETPPAPRVWTAPEHETAAAALLPDGGAVLGLGPTANWRGKTWPAERFAELVRRLTGADGILPGARVAVFAAANERDSARPVLEAVPQVRLIDLVGRVDLPTAAAALKRCALYVGNDSGLMHLAAAAGAPTLGLFGPSREEHYAPWGERTAVVRTPVPYKEMFPADYDYRTTETLMESLGVDAVEAAAVGLLRRCAEGRK